jgi:L-amino acid N-acyltransferase YncA
MNINDIPTYVITGIYNHWYKSTDVLKAQTASAAAAMDLHVSLARDVGFYIVSISLYHVLEIVFFL